MHLCVPQPARCPPRRFRPMKPRAWSPGTQPQCHNGVGPPRRRGEASSGVVNDERLNKLGARAKTKGPKRTRPLIMVRGMLGGMAIVSHIGLQGPNHCRGGRMLGSCQCCFFKNIQIKHTKIFFIQNVTSNPALACPWRRPSSGPRFWTRLWSRSTTTS